MGEQRLAHAEQLRQPARGVADLALVGAAVGGPLLKQGQAARLGVAADAAGQQFQIAQGQVEALAGHRVQGVGGVADHRRERHRLGAGLAEHQRVAGALTDAGEARHVTAEPFAQGGQKGVVVQGHPAVHVVAGAGPDQRHALAGQRQQGQRALVEEALERLAPVRLRQPDVGDQGVVADVPVAGADAEPVTGARAGAVGGDQQRRVQLFAIVQHGFIAVAGAADAGERGRGAQGDGRIRFHGAQQHMAEPAVFHHRAQARQVLLRGGEPGQAEPAAPGHVHGVDAGGVLQHRVLQAELLENRQAAGGQRRAAGVEAGRVRRLAGGQGVAFHQHDLARPVVAQQQRQGRPRHAAADDERGSAHARASRMSASMSSMALGTSRVSTSQPSLVTSTSSSMRMPMPRQRSSTVSSSGAM